MFSNLYQSIEKVTLLTMKVIIPNSQTFEEVLWPEKTNGVKSLFLTYQNHCLPEF